MHDKPERLGPRQRAVGAWALLSLACWALLDLFSNRRGSSVFFFHLWMHDLKKKRVHVRRWKDVTRQFFFSTVVILLQSKKTGLPREIIKSV
jgi:hypothetical protein